MRSFLIRWIKCGFRHALAEWIAAPELADLRARLNRHGAYSAKLEARKDAR